jgi:type VI secretion system protein
MNKAIALFLAAFLVVSKITIAGAVDSIRVVADSHANSDSATALDILFVYDSASVAALPKSGPEWFDKKGALARGLGSAIDIVALRIPPGYQTGVSLPANHASAIRVLSFADFLSPEGQPAGELTRYKSLTIRLTGSSILYEGNE